EGLQRVCELGARLNDGATGLPCFESPDALDGPIGGLALSRDEKRLVSAAADGTLRVRDTRTGATLARVNLVASLNRVAFLDERELAVATETGVVEFLDAQTLERVAPAIGHGGSIRGLAAYEGDAVVAGTSGVARLWHQGASRDLDAPKEWICGISLAPDRPRLAEATSGLRLIELAGGDPVVLSPA